MTEALERLRIYLGDERHIYNGSHALKRRAALGDWENVQDEIATLRARIAELEADKHGAYAERNLLVAALSKMFPAHLERTTIEGWDPEWEQCVYIELPTGQVSWHLKLGEEVNFAHLEWREGPSWDGHDTPEKYRRLAAIDAAMKPTD